MLLYHTGLNLKLSLTKLSLTDFGAIMYLLEPKMENGDGMSMDLFYCFNLSGPTPMIEALLDYLFSIFYFCPVLF
jgi:hypothetical protein